MHYAALVLFESSSDQAGYAPQFEESLILVTAQSADDARAKAAYFAHQRQSQYQTASGAVIRWILTKIVDISPVVDEPLGDGSEIYSRHFRTLTDYERFDRSSRNDTA